MQFSSSAHAWVKGNSPHSLTFHRVSMQSMRNWREYTVHIEIIHGHLHFQTNFITFSLSRNGLEILCKSTSLTCHLTIRNAFPPVCYAYMCVSGINPTIGWILKNGDRSYKTRRNHRGFLRRPNSEVISLCLS